METILNKYDCKIYSTDSNSRKATFKYYVEPEQIKIVNDIDFRMCFEAMFVRFGYSKILFMFCRIGLKAFRCKSYR